MDRPRRETRMTAPARGTDRSKDWRAPVVTAIEDALALLEAHAPTVSGSDRPADPLPSLLDRCEALVAEAAVAEPEPIRCVLALDAGAARMAARLLALVPNLHIVTSDALPDDAATVAAAAAQVEECRRRGLRLVRILRLSAAATLPPGARTVVMMRHPAAAWLEGRTSGDGLATKSPLDAYAAAAAAALDVVPGCDGDMCILQSETSEDDPAAALKSATLALALTLPACVEEAASLLLTDVPDDSPVPLAWPDGTPAVDAPLDSPAYAALCARIGYDPDRLPATVLQSRQAADPLPAGQLMPQAGRPVARLGALLDRLVALEARPILGMTPPPDVAALVALLDACLAEPTSAPEAIDAAAADLPLRDSALFLMVAAAHRAETGDRLLALDLMADAEDRLPPDAGAQGLLAVGAEVYLRLNETRMALALLAREALQGAHALEPRLQAQLLEAIHGPRHGAVAEHGHVVLIDWLSAHPPSPTPRLLVEIGTTRERVPGQGSTEKLARFCASRGIDFVTVDMDPRNASRAQRMFRRLGLPFRAITAKGDEWLAAYPGRIDYVFLDAYDFDHGLHSNQRQSRYQKFLGAPIDEAECHRMHLDCARTLSEKLGPDGLICLDDTWRDDLGKWTAKGTTAVPFLLGGGFRLIEARNRAALLGRA